MRAMSKYGAIVILVGGLIVAHPGGAAGAISDAWITTKTKIALLTARDVSGTAINVDTIDGVVTLHGTVPATAEKARAEAEARKIDGVKEVRNLVQVVPERQEKTVAASDAEIEDRVAKALKNDPGLAKSSVSVRSVNDGVVLLAGRADSLSDHLAAIETAYAVPGVRRVASDIQSPDRLGDAEIRREGEPETAGVRRGIGGAARDMWITTAVKMRLLGNGETPGTEINVDTRNGAVTLFGIVPSEAARSAAEAEARKVGGVARVVNHLEVVPSARKEQVEARDDTLQDEIAKRLEDRRDLAGADIDVEVKNGVARLTGTVENDQQRLAAAVTARSTPGVRAVHDALRSSAAERTP